MYQKMMERAHQAKQSGFILPMLTDQDGNKMFDFEIKNISGVKSYDIEKIIERLTREIQVGLFADVLSMGGNGGGSYSLSETKMTLIDMAVKSRLNEIKDQLNHQLVRTLFEQNGWDVSVTPTFDFELPNDETLDDKGKFIQRVAATGMMPLTPATVNFVLTTLGVDYQVPDDTSTEELRNMMTNFKSEAGKGMEQGMSNTNGNSTAGSGDASVSNNANT